MEVNLYLQLHTFDIPIKAVAWIIYSVDYIRTQTLFRELLRPKHFNDLFLLPYIIIYKCMLMFECLQFDCGW